MTTLNHDFNENRAASNNSSMNHDSSQNRAASSYGSMNKRRMTGTVISTKMQQTIVVQHEVRRRHPLYQKFVLHRTKFYVHDEKSQAQTGDRVMIEETRPLSKLKRWRLVAVLPARDKVNTRIN